MNNASLRPCRLQISDIPQVIAMGWHLFCGTLVSSLAFAGIPVALGLALLLGLVNYGLTPFSLSLAGGFMLLVPAMLGGFFYTVKNTQQGRNVTISTPFYGLLHAPSAVWVVALFSAFVFMIWLTDAGVLYSFTLGGAESEGAWLWFAPMHRSIVGFWFWSSLMGSFLAFVIFCVTAFSVPLLYERRAPLIAAVHASVRAVFVNIIPCMVWAFTLSLLTVVAVMLLPLLLILLPILAYASYFLYQRAFPDGS